MKIQRFLCRVTMVFAMLSLVRSVVGSTWVDPTWDQMIKQADVIGLFEVTEGGLNDGRVKVVQLLKGKLNKGEISLTQFNDPYWPDDAQREHSLRRGERHYMFLYSQAEVTETDPEEIRTKLLFVPTPTAGILPLEEDGTVRYSLVSTSYSWEREAKSAKEFEEFIRRAVAFKESGTPDPVAIEEALAKIRKGLSEKDSEKLEIDLPHWIATCRHWGGNGLTEEIDGAIKHQSFDVRYEAAKSIGCELPDPKAKNLLVKLLDDPNTLVQGVAVKHLMQLESDSEIGKLFTDRLAKALPGRVGPNNVMDPVRNSEDGGLLSMIEALGELNYKPAEVALARLMTVTKDETVCEAIFRTLREIESTSYIEPLRHQLKNGNANMRKATLRMLGNIPPVPELREEYEVMLSGEESDSYVPSLLLDLMKSRESVPVVKKFVEKLLSKGAPDTWDDDMCAKSIELFSEFDPDGCEEEIEEIMFYWTGADSSFVKKPELMELRRRLEAETKRKVAAVVPTMDQRKVRVECLVHLENRIALASGEVEVPEYSAKVEVVYLMEDENIRSESEAEFDWKKTREDIANAAGFPVANLGIRYQTRRGSWSGSTLDERLYKPNGWDLFGEYIDYAKTNPSERRSRLLKLYLDSGIAKHFNSEGKVTEWAEQDQ